MVAERRARAGGFTLVELVVAATVLTIGAVVVYPTFFAFQDLSYGAHQNNLATYDLDAAVEYVRGIPFESLVQVFPPPPPEGGEQPRPVHRPSPARWVWPVRLPAFDGVHFGAFRGPGAEERRMTVELEYPWLDMAPGRTPPQAGPYAGYFHPSLPALEPPDPLVLNLRIRWTDHAGRPRERVLTTAVTR